MADVFWRLPAGMSPESFDSDHWSDTDGGAIVPGLRATVADRAVLKGATGSLDVDADWDVGSILVENWDSSSRITSTAPAVLTTGEIVGVGATTIAQISAQNLTINCHTTYGLAGEVLNLNFTAATVVDIASTVAAIVLGGFEQSADCSFAGSSAIIFRGLIEMNGLSLTGTGTGSNNLHVIVESTTAQPNGLFDNMRVSAENGGILDTTNMRRPIHNRIGLIIGATAGIGHVIDKTPIQTNGNDGSWQVIVIGNDTTVVADRFTSNTSFNVTGTANLDLTGSPLTGATGNYLNSGSGVVSSPVDNPTFANGAQVRGRYDNLRIAQLGNIQTNTLLIDTGVTTVDDDANFRIRHPTTLNNLVLKGIDQVIDGLSEGADFNVTTLTASGGLMRDIEINVTNAPVVTGMTFINTDASGGAQIDATDPSNVRPADYDDTTGFAPSNPNIFYGIIGGPVSATYFPSLPGGFC